MSLPCGHFASFSTFVSWLLEAVIDFSTFAVFTSIFDLYCHNTSGIRPILMQRFPKMDTHNRASIRKTQKEETHEYMYLFVYVFYLFRLHGFCLKFSA
jgi:hypothetical protein